MWRWMLNAPVHVLLRHVLDGTTSLKSIAADAGQEALTNAGIDPLSVNERAPTT